MNRIFNSNPEREKEILDRLIKLRYDKDFNELIRKIEEEKNNEEK